METIRKLQFIVKGYRNFTKWDKPLPPLEGSLEGKNFVITGANSGIGYAAAKGAAQRRANVYLVCRNEQRGCEAVNKLKTETGNSSIFLVLGQMGEKRQIEKASEGIHARMDKIDMLVHNAGCMLHEREFTSDKIEKNFATNTFSVYYLTALCLNLLHKQSRVIVVSSGGCLTQPLEVEDIFMQSDDFDGTKQYARNKRQQLCLVERFAQKYPTVGRFVAMHPGWVDTASVRSSMPDFYEKMKGKLKDEEEGADTIMFLALAPLESLVNGEFYFDREVADKHLAISLTSHKTKEVDTLMGMLEKMAM